MRREEDAGFMEMVLNERIDALLKKTERKKGLEALQALEEMIATLPEEDQKKVKTWLELSVDMEAEDQRRVYLGGVTDGICIAVKIILIGIDGMLKPEQWIEKFIG